MKKLTPSAIRFAKNIVLKIIFNSDADTPKIFNPLLIIEYASART